MNEKEKNNYTSKLKQMTMEFNMPKEQSSIIKVIGVGGGGSNAVTHMFEKGIKGVNYIICNTDQQALDVSPVNNKLQLGPETAEGLGAGSKPEKGEMSTLESEEDIKKILANNTKMCFVTAGMGGGTGTGGAPVVARIAKEMGILTVGIVTTPFSFEGRRKLRNADEGIKKLKENVDALIVISNDKISEIFGDLSDVDAFAKANDILLNAAKSISEIITVPGHINVDFADVEYVMENSGIAIMGTGEAEGEDRALRAVQMALDSPLLDDNNITGARAILIKISSTAGDARITINEINKMSAYVQEAAGSDETEIIFGTCTDETLGDKISITLIATGFEKSKSTEKKIVNKEVLPLNELKIEETPSAGTTQVEDVEFEVNTTEETTQNETDSVKEEMFLVDKTEEQVEEEDELSFYTTPKPVEKRNETLTEYHQENINNYGSSSRERLRKMSFNLNEKQEHLEDVPAYKRRGIDIENNIPSSAETKSKYYMETSNENGEARSIINEDENPHTSTQTD